MPIVLTPTIWIILVAAALQAVTGLGWFITSGKLNTARAAVVKCDSEFASYRAQVAAQGRIAAERAKTIEAEHRRIADETATGWAKAIERVRADADSRLRLATSRGAGGSGLSAPADTRLAPAAADADAIPAPERIAADCAETTLTANYLQQYVERLQRE